MPAIKSQSKKKEPVKSMDSVLDRIVPLDNLPDEGIKLCVYGKSGTGKTRFVGTFAEKQGPLLHMICSSNGINEARSIRGLNNIQCVELQKSSDLSVLIDYAQENDFKTVVLDHVTGFADLVLAEILGVDKVPEQGSWGMAKREHYAQLGLQVKTHLRGLLDIPLNIIIVGQERAFDTAEESSDVLMPYVSVGATPAVAGWIAPAVDYMCQTFKREEVKITEKTMGGKVIRSKEKTGKNEFCLRVGPDATYITKFRVPPNTELPDVIVNPSYDKIQYLIEGNVNADIV
tara:strand:- start:66199 stop:67062 length:864 start_codon:yes stop_codon:yes gene_type:complete